jgi:hypothetical protein
LKEVRTSATKDQHEGSKRFRALRDAVAGRRPRAPADADEMGSNGSGPSSFAIRGPATASWREQALGRASEYRFLAHLLLPRASVRERQALHAIERHLDAAELAAAPDKRRNGRSQSSAGAAEATLGRWGKVASFVGGAAVERANSQLDAVETDLLRLAPDPYLRGQIPNLLAHVTAHLPPNDPRRQQVEAITAAVKVRKPDQRLTELERDQLLGATRAASLEARQEIRRVRSFRNVLLVTALILMLGVAGLTVLGATSPERVPVCFAPDNAMVVCPTGADVVGTPGGQTGGANAATDSASPEQQVRIDEVVRDTAHPWDIPVVEIVGLLAAALAAAFALRSIQGTSTPYSLPVAAAVLKLPTGALTAVFGLLLMRGGFIPGLSALDSSAQIIAWAIVFGYAQQLLTRFVDQQANNVLQNVGTPTNPQLGVPTSQPQQPQPQTA